MKKITTILRIGIFSICGVVLVAGDLMAYAFPYGKKTHPAPGPHQEIWKHFYEADSEGAIAPALVQGGRKMVPFICQAVRDPLMARRRYALLALGHLRDRRAIPTLETIYADTDEDSLFRGDAMEAIFVIDQDLGKLYARKVLDRGLTEKDYLRSTAQEIFDHPKQLLELPSD